MGSSIQFSIEGVSASDKLIVTALTMWTLACLLAANGNLANNGYGSYNITKQGCEKWEQGYIVVLQV